MSQKENNMTQEALAHKTLEAKKQGKDTVIRKKKEKKTTEQLIADLEKKLAIIKNKQRDKDRKNDTRRKILAGAFFLKKFSPENEIFQEFLNSLERDDNKLLFSTTK